jgi:hypothetical protein
VLDSRVCTPGEELDEGRGHLLRFGIKQLAEFAPSTPAKSSQYFRPVDSPPSSISPKLATTHPEPSADPGLQIHAGNMQRKVWRHRLELSRPDGPAPFPPRLDEHPIWYALAGLGGQLDGLGWFWGLIFSVRCRSLQGCPWTGFDCEAPDRDDFPGLRPPSEGMPTRSSTRREQGLTLDLVLSKSVPVQAAQEGRPGSYGDSHQAVKRPPSVPRPSSPALGQVTRYQPHHSHTPCCRVSQRRQEFLRPLSNPG